VAPNVVVPP
jgi:hypothetical protein